MTLPGHWRHTKERYAMLGRFCTQCGTRFLAPRLVCPVCHQEIGQLAEQIFPSLKLQGQSGAQKRKPAVTVIIPSFNAASTIGATLSSVMDQDLDEPYEVIVVDSSNDQTPAIIARDFAQVQLIHRDDQTDPGTARNLAISQAHGEIIACLDADCTAPSDWLRSMLAAQREGHTIVGGSVDNGNSQKLVAWAGFLGEFREFLAVGEPRLVPHLPTCNISYHRSIFSQFGGFPTSFYPQEDLLFHWRLGQYGVPIWFNPDIQVLHTHRVEWRPYLQHQRRIGNITARVLELTGGEGAFLARSPLLALSAGPVLPWVRMLRTVAHFATWQPKTIRRHWAALPILLVGLYAWAIGFVSGAWEDPLRVSFQSVLPQPTD